MSDYPECVVLLALTVLDARVSMGFPSLSQMYNGLLFTLSLKAYMHIAQGVENVSEDLWFHRLTLYIRAQQTRVMCTRNGA